MKPSGRALPLYLSAPHACSYLPDRLSSTLFTDPEQPMRPEIYDELLGYGFRRSGRMVYAPRCEHCRQCVSVRIPVAEFAARRNQRRIWLRNRDIEIHERAATFDQEHYALYQTYTAVRHEDGEMASATPAEYMGFLCADWCKTTFLEFRLDGQLLACAVTDHSDSALSAVYTYFDPTFSRRSLGALAILTQVEWAKRLDLPYLYLGYWIRDSRKMAYKTDYRPIEAWIRGRWQRFGPGAALPDPDHG